MASSRGSRHRRLLPVLLGVTLLSGGCQFTGVSEAGRERCRKLSAAAGNPPMAALSYVRCLPGSDSSLAAEKAADEQAAAARRAALESCRNRQRQINTLLASLRNAEQELAAARNSSFRPSEAPPDPLDAGKESRYRPEDQRLDRDRYEAALGAWEQQVAAQRAQWRQQRVERIAAAQGQLDRDAQALRRLQPDLFNAPASIEFDPTALRRVRADCDSAG
ncbi:MULTISPECIES: hypothetical protein [unclassified Cyanobium]|uniref:hypothetical protein n=1 Tax=unclassified Cyanobium TaxID=2627006 RepID=UPI0020CFBD96|nr:MULTISPECIES: hypothetical protein [unclassified Cyanobium]MCP9858424.1 hypothetical protein [Cyanobium sp. Cruz-8H5]MCP9865492.1 hypothetical protein [Cyanobium sp. Cruz-8D1]